MHLTWPQPCPTMSQDRPDRVASIKIDTQDDFLPPDSLLLLKTQTQEQLLIFASVSSQQEKWIL